MDKKLIKNVILDGIIVLETVGIVKLIYERGYQKAMTEGAVSYMKSDGREIRFNPPKRITKSFERAYNKAKKEMAEKA